MSTSSPFGPLQGVTVADFSQLAQGPFATQILGDMGADIIKIEPPKGDWMRHFALNNLYPGGVSISYLTFNRNKRSVVLDLKNPEGINAAKRLIAKADIVVENFRPGVMDRLGLGYEALKQENPRLIYCASCGLGHTGPYVKRPGQDMLIQAMSGITMLNGKDGQTPSPAPISIADLSTGLHIVYTILAALYSREQTGLGQRIDLNLLNSMLTMVLQELNLYLNCGEQARRAKKSIGNPYAGSPYGIYETMDGFIALGMNPLNLVARLVGAPGYEDISSNNVMEGRDDIHTDLEKCFRRRPTAEWLEILLAEDVWCGPVYSFADVEKDPQVKENEMIAAFDHPQAGRIRVAGIPAKFSGTPAAIRRPPPNLGEHTDEILRQLAGYSDAEIRQLRVVGAVK
ncbi:CoA transferase [soil metagenome]